MTCLFNDSIGHALFHAQGIATMGLDPAWDRAVSAYIAADVRSRAHEEFGPLAHRKSDADLDTIYAEMRLGKDWRNTDEGLAIARSFDDASAAYEAGMEKDFYSPLWKAQRDLALTPAPSLLAAVWKAAAISLHEIWNDRTLDTCLASAIDAELARFAGGEQ